MNVYKAIVFGLLIFVIAGPAQAQIMMVADGQTVTIDAHGVCQKVTNNGGPTTMVPHLTAAEWTSFRNGKPGHISLSSCQVMCATDPTVIGCVADDGAVYAGTSGGNRLYAAPADESGTYTWNNGTGNWTYTNAASKSDGLANTDMLDALSDAGAPYDAAEVCRSRGADWYLPATDELSVMYDNWAAIGDFNTDGAIYWSSSEFSDDGALVQRFSDGVQGRYVRSYYHHVRCVRR